MRLLLLSLFLLLPGAALSQTEADCHADVPCILGDRSYHVKLPDDWDGVSPMPVMLHFHGWQRQGTLIVKHKRISGATRVRGVLLLAPNGRSRTWNFWSSRTDDVDFAARVLEDAAKKWPIDTSRIYVSGYSFGSAMAWRFVCERGEGIRALLAVSGTLRQTEDCGTPPREVRHVHGTSDTVMDFPFGPGGDTTYPVALWRRVMKCGDGVSLGTWQVTERDIFERTAWEGCGSGGRVLLDVHSRGHFIPRGWFARQLDELLAAES